MEQALAKSFAPDASRHSRSRATTQLDIHAGEYRAHLYHVMARRA